MAANTSEQHDHESPASLSPDDDTGSSLYATSSVYETSSIYEPAVMESPVFVEPNVHHKGVQTLETTTENVENANGPEHAALKLSLLSPDGIEKMAEKEKNNKKKPPGEVEPPANRAGKKSSANKSGGGCCCCRAMKFARKVLKASWEFYMLGPDWSPKQQQQH